MNPVWHFLNGIPQVGPLTIGSAAVTLADSATLGWSDVSLSRLSADTLGLRRGTNTQSFLVGPDADYLALFKGTGAAQIYTSGGDNLEIGPETSGEFRIVNRNVEVLFATDVATKHFLGKTATGGIGYGTGAGGTVTQLTNKSTGVTLSTVTGEITMNGAALAADTTVSFTLTNTAIAAGDFVDVRHVSVGTQAAYNCTAVAAAGSATVNVRNITPGSLSEAIVLKFMVWKSATA